MERLRENVPYISNNPDLASILEGQEGTFEVVAPTGDAFTVVCKEGHSIKSLIPAGHRYNWQVRKLEAQPAESLPTESEYARSRRA